MNRGRLHAAGLALLVAVQAICAWFFVWDIVASVLGIPRRPIAWETRELMEIGASVGLVLGLALGALLLIRSVRQNRKMAEQVRAASSAFAELLEERFAEWGLTPSERDVAWFTIKGLPIAEIARLRETSEGTVKAQSNAIYRKAGVGSRSQLVSLFIEDLMERSPPRTDAPRPSATEEGRPRPPGPEPTARTATRAAPPRKMGSLHGRDRLR
jgi:DNA-binding CsgD family transcriptional regulator